MKDIIVKEQLKNLLSEFEKNISEYVEQDTFSNHKDKILGEVLETVSFIQKIPVNCEDIAEKFLEGEKTQSFIQNWSDEAKKNIKEKLVEAYKKIDEIKAEKARSTALGAEPKTILEKFANICKKISRFFIKIFTPEEYGKKLSESSDRGLSKMFSKRFDRQFKNVIKTSVSDLKKQLVESLNQPLKVNIIQTTQQKNTKKFVGLPTSPDSTPNNSNMQPIERE